MRTLVRDVFLLKLVTLLLLCCLACRPSKHARLQSSLQHSHYQRLLRRRFKANTRVTAKAAANHIKGGNKYVKIIYKTLTNMEKGVDKLITEAQRTMDRQLPSGGQVNLWAGKAEAPMLGSFYSLLSFLRVFGWSLSVSRAFGTQKLVEGVSLNDCTSCESFPDPQSTVGSSPRPTSTRRQRQCRRNT